MSMQHSWNDSDKRKPTYSHKACASANLTTQNPTRTGLGLNPGICNDRPVPFAPQNTNTNLTPRSRVLPQKLTCPKLLKKFLTFYGTRRFISVFTRARHLSLSWANQSSLCTPQSNLSKIRNNNILPSTPWFSKWFLPSGFPTKALYVLLLFHIRATCPAHLSFLDFITRIIFGKE